MLLLNRAPSRKAGRTLGGRYLLHEEIGRGRFGEVYRAEDLQTGEEVALKSAECTEDNLFAQKVFDNERRALSKVDHPSVVRLAGSGASDGAGFIAMEYIRGINLKEFLNRRKTSREAGLGMMLDVCGALESMHSSGVVHRDLKPKNAMVASDGSVKLIDFGFAHVQGWRDPTSGFSRPFGSPVYSPPEDLRGNSDHRADIFSAGIMLYEMLMERSMFYLIDAMKLLHLRVSVSRLREEAVFGQMSPKAYDIIMQATQRDPCRRFQSAREMGQAILSMNATG